jgi:hypothetical protein
MDGKTFYWLSIFLVAFHSFYSPYGTMPYEFVVEANTLSLLQHENRQNSGRRGGRL